jgi:hypothetical protein
MPGNLVTRMSLSADVTYVCGRELDSAMFIQSMLPFELSVVSNEHLLHSVIRCTFIPKFVG